MSVRYHGGPADTMYLECDDDSCDAKLGSDELTKTHELLPSLSSGWQKIGDGVGRRDYCPQHHRDI